MSIVAGVGKAAGAEVPTTGARPTGRAFPKTKRALVAAVALLLALATFAALIPASQAPNAGHSYYSAASTDSQSGAAPQHMSEREALDAYGKLPLSFVPNEGQTDKAVRYYAQGAGYGFFFTEGGAMLSFAEGKGRGGHALALNFLGANPHATLTARQRLPGKVNYEFHLKPGSSVEDVRLGYRGAEGLKVGAGGELLVRTSLGVLKDAAPVSYQRIGGERVPVESRYRLTGDGGYGFAVGAYDPRYPLVIDPGLDYSTFLGKGHIDAGLGIAVRDGNAYVTGFTSTVNYPTTPGAYDRTYNSSTDAFVTKLNASGSALVYSTFLGGTNHDEGLGIAVDGTDRVYVTGVTRSVDYPTTSSALDTTKNGFSDAFVTKLNASGSALAYSTFLGGTSDDAGRGIAVREGRAYVTGQTTSADYPTTPGAFDTTHNGNSDAFVTKLNASGSGLVYSTFLGGTSYEIGAGIAVQDGMAYVTGQTESADFPTTTGAFDTTHNGFSDAFVTKLNASGSELTYSTFLGGTSGDVGLGTSGEVGLGIAVREGRAYVAGHTTSADYPTTPGAFDTTFNGGNQDAFVTVLNTSGSALAYSTFLGGASGDFVGDIALDGSGRAYVTGQTTSADYPTTHAAFDPTFNGNSDAFVTKLPTG